jgi:RNA polymerase sigma-70 factor (ECF subfamily)
MLAHVFDYETTLAACAQGNQTSLRDLFNQEAPHMLALAARMLADNSAAEIIVRDTFILIWKNASSYDRDVGTARAWIYSIMRYRVMNRLSQMGRASPALKTNWQDDLPLPSNAEDPPGIIGKLNELDPAQRLPILMAYYHGLNYEQIAALTHVPQAQIKTQVHAALAVLSEVESA